MTKKLTRKDIKQALAETPIETILLGHNTGGVNLTAKQKEFARQVAEGKPKAEAYRNAYDSNGTKDTQAQEGHRLANNPKVSAMIESFKLANEAQKYLLPAQLRTLAIQRLTELAIDDTVKPAQQLKALELIGKMTDVALFTERKEIVQVRTTEEARAKLIEGIKLAISSDQPIDAEYSTADDLLAEIRGDYAEQDADQPANTIDPASDIEESAREGEGIDNSQADEPTTPQPPKIG